MRNRLSLSIPIVILAAAFLLIGRREQTEIIVRPVAGGGHIEERLNWYGERHGVSRWFNAHGWLEREICYDHGQLIWRKEYHPDGTLRRHEQEGGGYLPDVLIGR